jgi:hypothetical protein
MWDVCGGFRDPYTSVLLESFEQHLVGRIDVVPQDEAGFFFHR